MVVLELQVKGLQRIVVLEADPDRESYVKQWANGEVESTREVRQRQATLNEEAFFGESEESAKDLVEEEPLDAEEDEENYVEEEDEEDEGDSDSSNDDDNDTSKSEASRDKDSLSGNNVVASEASRDKDSLSGNNVVASEASKVEEEEESNRGYVCEHGNDGDTRRNSHSEVDNPLQIRRTETGRGSREPVHRGVLVRGKGKGTMADVRRSLSGRQSIRPAGLVRRSMPARVEPEHAVGASLLRLDNKHGCRYA